MNIILLSSGKTRRELSVLERYGHGCDEAEAITEKLEFHARYANTVQTADVCSPSSEGERSVKLEDLQTLESRGDVVENGTLAEECLEKNVNLTGNFCPAYYDGLLCWDPTPWYTNAVQKCFKEFHGVQYDDTKNASRICLGGVWNNYTDYSNCTERTDIGPPGPPPDITSLIYLAGYSLSLAVLSLAVFVFLYFKDLRCLRNTIHTNLMSTYILSACSWILNLVLQHSHQDQTSCVILVTCMHYFYLTNFFWMLVEGLYLYMLVVETFTAENIKLKVYTTIGWGVPAVFITIWVICRCFVSPAVEASQAETKLCTWMHDHQVDWIHKAPTLIDLALNLFFLIRIMWVLITKLRSANTLETEQYRKATKALLVLIPLLGITNLLVLCGPSDDSWFAHAFEYTRALMLSTQGFTVALFYCFMNTEVRHAIRYHVERWKTGRAIGGGRRRGTSYSKDWSPRSRTESIRLTV
ncbi:7 transmembrane receptor (Secretin family) domain-containing protein [Phthorimaea operculella]|nr:7 transmembrane receptor (Secretin family) domain-containing protein [Phthorimaea operculella]